MIQFVGDLRQVGCFSPATPVSSTNKTDRHDITEILLKVSLNTITLILTFISKYATGAILQNTRIDLHNLFNIRCLLYIFLLFYFDATRTSDDIPYGVTSGFIFSTDQ